MIQLYQNINVLKVLAKLMDDPYKGFYIREIARDLDMSPMTVKRSLDLLASDGIIVRYQEKNNTLFRADPENGILRFMKISYNLSKIKDQGIVERIISQNEGIISITLYGSFATGKNDPGSDLDLLILSSTRRRIIHDIFSDMECDVSLIEMRPDEWSAQSVKNKAFYNEVIRDGIPLYGKKLVV
jgi:predicted nucleotidyltransferase